MKRYTALVIQNEENDIRCEALGRDAKTGKWAGAVTLYHDGHLHTTLLSSEPTFESSEAAVAYMEDIVRQVRAADVLA